MSTFTPGGAIDRISSGTRLYQVRDPLQYNVDRIIAAQLLQPIYKKNHANNLVPQKRVLRPRLWRFETPHTLRCSSGTYVYIPDTVCCLDESWYVHGCSHWQGSFTSMISMGYVRSTGAAGGTAVVREESLPDLYTTNLRSYRECSQLKRERSYQTIYRPDQWAACFLDKIHRNCSGRHHREVHIPPRADITYGGT